MSGLKKIKIKQSINSTTFDSKVRRELVKAYQDGLIDKKLLVQGLMTCLAFEIASSPMTKKLRARIIKDQNKLLRLKYKDVA